MEGEEKPESGVMDKRSGGIWDSIMNKDFLKDADLPKLSSEEFDDLNSSLNSSNRNSQSSPIAFKTSTPSTPKTALEFKFGSPSQGSPRLKNSFESLLSPRKFSCEGQLSPQNGSNDKLNSSRKSSLDSLQIKKLDSDTPKKSSLESLQMKIQEMACSELAKTEIGSLDASKKFGMGSSSLVDSQKLEMGSNELGSKDSGLWSSIMSRDYFLNDGSTESIPSSGTSTPPKGVLGTLPRTRTIPKSQRLPRSASCEAKLSSTEESRTSRDVRDENCRSLPEIGEDHEPLEFVFSQSESDSAIDYAHVVSAFEQSLSNMTQRLQSLTNTSHQKDSELNDLKRTIESLRQQSGEIRIDHSSGDPTMQHRRISAPAPPLSVYSSPEHCLTPGGPLTRQLSSESMSSVNSMSSACSVGSQHSTSNGGGRGDKGDKKNKGGWLRSSFSKAFSKQKKGRKGSMSDLEGDAVSIASDISVPHSPLPAGSQSLPGAYSSAIKQSHSETRLGTEDVESVQKLQAKLQEKDMKLTDIQLEALSSAHQLEQLRETMIKMKNEMHTLKADNDRLQKMVVVKSPMSPDRPVKRSSLTDDSQYGLQEHASNIDVLLNETSSDGRRVLISVYLGNDTDSAAKSPSAEVLIGSMCVTGKIRWDMLDSIIRRYFKDYCIKVDPACHLGLNSESVHSYHIGDITRTKESTETPELLPCGYLVGEDMQIKIVLKGTEQQAVDSLSFETLIPKSIIQRYISLLVEHRRIILCGPSGTGKTYLAHKLAEFLVRRSGRALDSSAISTFSVEHKSSKELRQYLANIADQCQQEKADLPCVIILDNLHHVGSLSEVFDGFLSCKYQKSPYIIGTMNQATCSTTNLQLHHNFRWVLCANHMEPVKGFLGRFLKRKLIEAELRLGSKDLDLAKMVDWMPLVWQKLNKFLETHSSSDVTIGPRLFLSCPMDISGSQVWFTDLYNYSLVPYLMDATREGLQLYGRRAPWEDPAEWVMEHYPWASPSSQEYPALLRIRPEDVGYDTQVVAQPGTPGGKTPAQNPNQDNEQDPLLNMLMRLQEAASYSSPQSADSDSQSQDDSKMALES